MDVSISLTLSAAMQRGGGGYTHYMLVMDGYSLVFSSYILTMER